MEIERSKEDSPDFLAGGGELGALVRAFDWTATPLGPPRLWPQSLRTAVRIMLTSRQPFWIGWGETLTYLYNDAYKSIIGGKHPWALGRPTEEVWSEIWPDIEPMLATAKKGDEGTYVEEQLLIMERNGYQEETYYTFSYSPIPLDRGVGGIICANTDDTRRVIGERQLALSRDLAAVNTVHTIPEACLQIARALETNLRDLPFAMIFLAGPAGGDLSLAAASGIAPDHPLARIEAWPGDAAAGARGEPIACELAETPAAPVPAGAWGTPPSRAALLSIPASGDAGRAGVLVAGLNPFRLFDQPYRDFLKLIASQIGAAIASAQAYENEKKRADALTEIDRAKTAFFSNISHEFRTPLTLMLAPVEDALARRTLARRDLDDLEIVHRNGLRLLRLVNALLDFSRVEAGRTQAVYQATDLAVMTAGLAASFRPLCEKAGLRLVVDCKPLGEPSYVDRDMWEKVVLNLLSNAFKSTFDGEIEVKLEARDRHAVLTVRDTGTGIPASDLPRIFERFHRVEDARRRTHEGSGIGLALVQELVKLHGGAVAVESKPGAGTVFDVRIPFGTEHLPRDRVGGTPPRTSTAVRADAFVEEAWRWLPQALAAAPEVRPAAAPRARILLAEDNADMRDYIGRVLSASYEVRTVADGQEALGAAKAEAPDLVLSDVMMPRLDGFGLLAALRADPRLRDVPVVLLSARAGDHAVNHGIAAGADDYIAKPFTALELLARVKKQLDVSRSRAQATNELRESEGRFRNLADHAPVMIWVTETDGSCSYLNRRWYAYTGQSAEQGLGYGWLDAVHPDDRDRSGATFKAANAARQSFRLRYRLRGADGVYRLVIDSAAPRFDEAGRFLGYVGSVIEIDEPEEEENHAAA